MTVVSEHLGHDLVARAESAKIAVADGGSATIDLDHVEPGLRCASSPRPTRCAPLDADLERIVDAARATVAQAGLGADADRRALLHRRLDRARLAERAAAPRRSAGARVVRGDRFASVATGLALFAQRRFAVRRRR